MHQVFSLKTFVSNPQANNLQNPKVKPNEPNSAITNKNLRVLGFGNIRGVDMHFYSRRKEVMDTILKLNREKDITIVLITHYMDEAVLADRVIVLDNGKIIEDGTPRSVFSNVEFLKCHSLDVPQATELAYRLSSSGMNIEGTPLNEWECAEAIIKSLE